MKVDQKSYISLVTILAFTLQEARLRTGWPIHVKKLVNRLWMCLSQVSANVINNGASEDEPKEHAALLLFDRIYDRYIPNIEMA